jgi:hypothetical protein
LGLVSQLGEELLQFFLLWLLALRLTLTVGSFAQGVPTGSGIWGSSTISVPTAGVSPTRVTATSVLGDLDIEVF